MDFTLNELQVLLADSIGNQANAKGVEVEKWKGVVAKPHVQPKAKRVIFLCQAGGASHLETYDWKPKLAEMHGKPMPESYQFGFVCRPREPSGTMMP